MKRQPDEGTQADDGTEAGKRPMQVREFDEGTHLSKGSQVKRTQPEEGT